MIIELRVAGLKDIHTETTHTMVAGEQRVGKGDCDRLAGIKHTKIPVASRCGIGIVRVGKSISELNDVPVHSNARISGVAHIVAQDKSITRLKIKVVLTIFGLTSDDGGCRREVRCSHDWGGGNRPGRVGLANMHCEDQTLIGIVVAEVAEKVSVFIF